VLYFLKVEKKLRALEQAALSQDWALPAVFERLRRLLQTRVEQRGRRQKKFPHGCFSEAQM